MLVTVEIDKEIAVVTLDNPPVNALSTTVQKELLESLDSLWAEKQARAVVLTGNPEGRNVFCAGADINEFVPTSNDEATQAWSSQEMKFVESIMTYPLPLVCAVNGPAIGGGLELALACDIVIAAPEARFAFPEITLAAFPGNFALAMSTRIMGPNRTRYLALTGIGVDARWMLDAGVLSEIVDRQELVSRAKEIAAMIAGFSRPSVEAVRELVQAAGNVQGSELKLMLLYTQKCYRSPELRKQLEEFRQRRASTTGSR
jgi:enoyl-CoA hydratase/carnithine racemase